MPKTATPVVAEAGEIGSDRSRSCLISARKLTLASLMPELTCSLGPDSCGELLKDFFTQAEGQLDIAVWDVERPYAELAMQAAKRGVVVRMLLDTEGPKLKDTLAVLRSLPTLECRSYKSVPGNEAHWKILLSGEDHAAIGTGNLTWGECPWSGRTSDQPRHYRGTREWWVFLRDAPLLVKGLRSQIDDAWNRSFSPVLLVEAEQAGWAWDLGTPVPQVDPITIDIDPVTLSSGTTGSGSRSALETMLSGCGKRALLNAPYIFAAEPAVHDLLHTLSDLGDRRVDVRILLGQKHGTSGADIALLQSLRLNVRIMNPARCTAGHSKGAVVDDGVLVTSANWSSGGLSANREGWLRIDEAAAAQYYADCFERDWETADPLG